jgi:hypothetical protein
MFFHAAILVSITGLAHATSNGVEWALMPSLPYRLHSGCRREAGSPPYVPAWPLRTGLAALLLLTGYRMSLSELFIAADIAPGECASQHFHGRRLALNDLSVPEAESIRPVREVMDSTNVGPESAHRIGTGRSGVVGLAITNSSCTAT